jgi:putative inorganic carbon (hco3(-)) transporter
LAILMLLLFPLAFYLYHTLKNRINRWEKYLLIICCICPILTILGASSRGAQIALIIQLIFMFRRSVFKIKPLIGVFLLCATIFYLLPQEQKERFSNTGSDKTSQHGWEMMKENPLTGVGFFNFVPYYENHFSQDMLYARAELPHNIFIQVGTDAGFIALGLFMGIIGYCLYVTYSISKNTTIDPVICACAAGLGLGVFGFLVAGQFVTVSYYPFLWIHLALIVVLKTLVLKTGVLKSLAATRANK